MAESESGATGGSFGPPVLREDTGCQGTASGTRRIMESDQKLDDASIARIVREFDADDRVMPFTEMEVNRPLPLDRSFMLSARLERAAGNQLCNGEATVSRYAIWAETIRGIILDAIGTLEEVAPSSNSTRNLMRAANSLAAFSTVQQSFDPYRE